MPLAHLRERAASQLARQKPADWLLLDNQVAREKAQELGLPAKGTLGVIVDAHRRHLISAEQVELIVQAILDRDDISVSDALAHRVCDAWQRKAADPE